MRSQPPPDERSDWLVPPGYRLKWVEADPEHERLATTWEHENRYCRRPGCRRRAVWALLRARRSAAGRSMHWWLYCDWHHYGRKIEGGKVLRRWAVKDNA